MPEHPPPIDLNRFGRIILESHAARRLPAPREIAQVTGLLPSNRIVAVCAMPKSGSTYLANVFRQLLDRPHVPVCFAYASNEHDLYLPAMLYASRTGAVSQLHIKGTPHNAALFNLFKVRPILLTRNIFDALESLARDLRHKQGQEGYGSGWIGYSFVWLDRNIAALSDERLYDFVIDMALPWYVNFYVSWYRLAEQGQVSPIRLDYGELMADRHAAVARLLRELGFPDVKADPAVLDADHLSERNVISRGTGESSLGRARFTAEQAARIERLLDYYPDVDFSPLVGA